MTTDDDTDLADRPAVRLSSSEVSLSIEETNRLRAELGLRPLRTEPSRILSELTEDRVERRGASSSPLRRNGGDGPDAKPRSDSRKQLPSLASSRAKEEGLRQDIALAHGLGEEDAGDEEDLAAWVERSRGAAPDASVPDAKSLEAPRIPGEGSRVTCDQNPVESNVARVRLSGMSDVVLDNERILTLADQSLLEEGGNALNENEDLLENAEDREASIARRNEKLRKVLSSSVYDPTDNAEFETTNAPDNRTILAKYDQEADDPKFLLKSDGHVTAVGRHDTSSRSTGRDALEGHRDLGTERLRAKMESALPSTLLESAFFTKEEYDAKFKKRSTSKGTKAGRNAKKRRRSGRDDTTDGNMEGGARSRASPGNSSLPILTSGTSRLDQLRKEASIRLQHDVDADDVGDEDDKELREAIARARKSALRAQARLLAPNAESVVFKVVRDSQELSGKEQDNPSVQGASAVVINEADHFIPRYRDEATATRGEVYRNLSDRRRHAFGGGEDDVGTENVGTPDRFKSLDQMRLTSKIAVAPEGGSSTIPAPRLTGEAELGESMSAAHALARFRDLGALNRPVAKEGRARDARGDGTTSSGPRDVKLIYTDDRGQEVTQKEAFRILSHKFHGKGPGQNKKEARMRRHVQSRESDRKTSVGDTPLGSVAALKEETRRTGSAHVLLSGAAAISGHHGLTPASGFEPGISRIPENVRDREDESGHELPGRDRSHYQSDAIGRTEPKVEFSLGSVSGPVAKRTRRT